MSKSVLIGALAVCVLAVGMIAALTATVIVDDSDSEGGRILRVAPSPVPGPGVPLPGPGRGRQLPAPGGVPRTLTPGRLPELKRCVEEHFGRPGAVQPGDLRGCLLAPGVR